MNKIKERLIGAITVMTDEEAQEIWSIIERNHMSRTWDEIEEVEPDEIDNLMLKEIEENPDCHEFVSYEEALRILEDNQSSAM